MSALLKDGRVRVTGLYSEKTGKAYDATVVLEDDGPVSYTHLDVYKRQLIRWKSGSDSANGAVFRQVSPRMSKTF